MIKFKKIITFSIFLITFLSFAYSEDSTSEITKNQTEIEEKKEHKLSNHEVYLGYGSSKSTIPEKEYQIFTKIVTYLTDKSPEETETFNYSSYGVIQLGYNWYCLPKKKFSIGPTLIIEPYGLKHTFSDDSSKNYTETGTIFTIQAKAKYQYGWKYVKLYHGASLGLSFFTVNSSSKFIHYFSFNIIPIGIKVGKDYRFNFFADLGIGTTPFINIGLSYRF